VLCPTLMLPSCPFGTAIGLTGYPWLLRQSGMNGVVCDSPERPYMKVFLKSGRRFPRISRFQDGAWCTCSSERLWSFSASVTTDVPTDVSTLERARGTSIRRWSMRSQVDGSFSILRQIVIATLVNRRNGWPRERTIPLAFTHDSTTQVLKSASTFDCYS
jgi:hypothetical protein